MHGLQQACARMRGVVVICERSGRVLSVLSLSMIVLSIVLVCIETLPEIQEDEYTIEIFAWAELTIVIFFTVEYVARFLVANRCEAT